MTDSGAAGAVVDLRSRAHAGEGAAWAHAGEQLNATLLSWPAGHEVATHVNDEREVLLLVVDGSGVVRIDEQPHDVHAGCALVIPRGAGRSIHAGPNGLAYVSAHVARGPLQVTRRSAPIVPEG